MTQLLLDLGAAPAPSFDNFVPGSNGEALRAARAMAEAISTLAPAATQTLYLWGPGASGKSHLLAAACRHWGAAAAAFRSLDANSPLEAFQMAPGLGEEAQGPAPVAGSGPQRGSAPLPGPGPGRARVLWALDDCHRLDGPRQIAAFHLFDAVRSRGGFFLATGDQPPAHLELMPELGTRLGSGLVLQLHCLTDEQKAEALTRNLRERGLKVQDGVVSWLLTHVDRDLAHLRQIIDALDTYALREKRPLSLPLVRRWLSEVQHQARTHARA